MGVLGGVERYSHTGGEGGLGGLDRAGGADEEGEGAIGVSVWIARAVDDRARRADG